MAICQMIATVGEDTHKDWTGDGGPHRADVDQVWRNRQRSLPRSVFTQITRAEHQFQVQGGEFGEY